MGRTVIKEHFWIAGSNGDKTLAKEDLGWPRSVVKDVQSDYPETIFRYMIEIAGFNLLLYWTRDEMFYAIETEKSPIEVRRIYPNPKWNGECEFQKADSDLGPNTASQGELIASFEEPVDVWDNLKIRGVPIGAVIEESMIIEWD